MPKSTEVSQTNTEGVLSLKRSSLRNDFIFISTHLLAYLFANREFAVYQNPDEYEAGAFSGWSKRDNLARGVADVVEKALLLSEGKRVLDLGAGTGILSFELANRNLDVVALDLLSQPLQRQQEKLSEACEKTRVFTLQGNMNEQFPFSENSFDCVVTLRASRYIKNFNAFLSEAMRVLKPNGSFILPIFLADTIPWKRHSNKGIFQETSVRAIKNKIIQTGFEFQAELSGNYVSQANIHSGQREVPFYYRPAFVVARKNS